MVPPAPAEFSIRIQVSSVLSSSTCSSAGTTCSSPASSPLPRCEPTWKTTPSAPIAEATSVVLRMAAIERSYTTGSGVARFTRYTAWQRTPPIPAAARFSRKRSKLSGSWFVGRQARGLCVKTCTESASSSTARSIALSIPPAEEMCAPISTAAYAIRMAVVVRMAPSPTGFLHVGGVRTFLFNWLFARHQGGKNLLRIENTDTSREVAEAVDQIQESLSWLGIDWDGPLTFQLDRMDDCRRIADQLVSEGKAYEDEGAIRFRMPDEGVTAWDDVVRGRVEFPNEKLEDVVLVRGDGRPTYNFASPMEDVWDEISHV